MPTYRAKYFVRSQMMRICARTVRSGFEVSPHCARSAIGRCLVVNLGSELLNQRVYFIIAAEDAFFLKEFLDFSAGVHAFFRCEEHSCAGSNDSTAKECVQDAEIAHVGLFDMLMG